MRIRHNLRAATILAVVAWAAACETPAEPANHPPVVVRAGPIFLFPFGTDAVIVMGVEHLFEDPDGDSLTYSAKSSDPTLATASVSEKKLEIRTVSPGMPIISITARDPGGLTATYADTMLVYRRR